MPYLNIIFWTSIGIIIGWFAHNWHISRDTTVATPTAALHIPQPIAKSAANAPTNNNEAEQQTLREFRRYLALANIDAAIKTYTTTQNRELLEEMRKHLLNQVEKWIMRRRKDTAQTMLNRYLRVDAYNPRALWLQANLDRFDKRYEKALERAFEVKMYAEDAVLINHADKLIKETSAAYEQMLRSQKQWVELEALFALLLEKDPASQPGIWSYKLGKAQYHQELFPEALATLRLASGYPSVQQKAEALIYLIEQLIALDGELKAIPITNSEAGWIIEVQLNNDVIANLLIDTGANRTILSGAFAEDTEIYVAKEEEDEDEVQEDEEQEEPVKVAVRTASDVVEMILIRLDKMTVGDMVFGDMTVGVMKMPQSDVHDGLLGMDFLSQFEFQIDQTNEMLLLNL